MPGAPLPLHIFEPRYRQLTVDLVTGAVPDKAVRRHRRPRGLDAGDETAVLHSVGCTAELLDVRRLPDGRYDIVTRGCRRFRLLDVDTEARPYLMAEVEYLPDVPEEPADDLADLAGAARAAHRRYCATAWKSGDWSEPAEDIAPAELPHLLAADCLLPMSDRQRLLEQTSPGDPAADGAGPADPRGGAARASCTPSPPRCTPTRWTRAPTDRELRVPCRRVCSVRARRVSAGGCFAPTTEPRHRRAVPRGRPRSSSGPPELVGDPVEPVAGRAPRPPGGSRARRPR